MMNGHLGTKRRATSCGPHLLRALTLDSTMCYYLIIGVPDEKAKFIETDVPRGVACECCRERGCSEADGARRADVFVDERGVFVRSVWRVGWRTWGRSGTWGLEIGATASQVRETRVIGGENRAGPIAVNGFWSPRDRPPTRRRRGQRITLL